MGLSKSLDNRIECPSERGKVMSSMWAKIFVVGIYYLISFSVVQSSTLQREPLIKRLFLAAWPPHLYRWLVHSDDRLGRYIWNTWIFVVVGWLSEFEFNMFGLPQFYWAVWATFAFIVLAVDATASKLYGRPVKKVLRAFFWPVSLYSYMCDPDVVHMSKFNKIVWVLLISTWLWGNMGGWILRVPIMILRLG